MKTRMGLGLATLAFAMMTAVASKAEAAQTAFTATLSGAYVSPPVITAGTGFSTNLQWDDGTTLLTGTLTFSGLSGPPTFAHLHRGAACTNGAIMESQGPQSGLTVNAPVQGADVAALMNGELYFDVHTAMYPNGEIRGQIQVTADAGTPPVCGPVDGGADASTSDASVDATADASPIDAGDGSSTPPPVDSGSSSDASASPECPPAPTDDGGCATTSATPDGGATFVVIAAIAIALARRTRGRSGTSRRS